MSSIFDILYYPLGFLVRLCNAIVPNYAIALLLFALFIKLILLPFGIKQQKNSIKQASLRPREMAIRKKYAGRTDKPTQLKMNEEIQQLYQSENYNMFGSCINLLIQFPILMALYTVIRSPLQYVQMVSTQIIDKMEVRFLSLVNDETLVIPQAIKDAVERLSEANITALNADPSSVSSFRLQQIDMISALKNNEGLFDRFADIFAETNIASVADLPNFMLFGIDLSQTPTVALNWLILIPILTFVFLFFSMKITRRFTYQPTDQQSQDAMNSMKIMDFTMPLLSVWITFSVPAAIGLYWIYQNIFSTIQQIILAKVMPLPRFTEEDYKEAERKYLGSLSKKEKKKIRSLHHIDDDDVKAEAKEQKASPSPAPSPIDKPVLKRDERKRDARCESAETEAPKEKKKVRSLHRIDEEDEPSAEDKQN